MKVGKVTIREVIMAEGECALRHRSVMGMAWWAWHDGAEGDLGTVQCVSKSSHRVLSGHSYFVRDVTSVSPV